MVAVRDIAALETILVEKAAASGPKLAHPAVCVECLASVDTRYIFFKLFLAPSGIQSVTLSVFISLSDL